MFPEKNKEELDVDKHNPEFGSTAQVACSLMTIARGTGLPRRAIAAQLCVVIPTFRALDSSDFGLIRWIGSEPAGESGHCVAF